VEHVTTTVRSSSSAAARFERSSTLSRNWRASDSLVAPLSRRDGVFRCIPDQHPAKSPNDFNQRTKALPPPALRCARAPAVSSDRVQLSWRGRGLAFLWPHQRSKGRCSKTRGTVVSRGSTTADHPTP
jgi:hypothetical protein